MREASFSIAIVRGGEGGVAHGVHSLLPSRLCWARGAELERGPRSPPASPRPTGEPVWCEGLLQISMQKKKYKPLQGLGQTFSKLRTFVLQCCRAWPERRQPGRGSVAPGHDAHKAHLHCCLSPVILYTP